MVAFPNISIGVYGYPLPDAAQVAIEAVRESDYPDIEKVIFVCFDPENFRLYEGCLGDQGGTLAVYLDNGDEREITEYGYMATHHLYLTFILFWTKLLAIFWKLGKLQFPTEPTSRIVIFKDMTNLHKT